MPRTVGLDFGTTNTVLAERQLDGRVTAATFQHADTEHTAFRTVLAFWQERQDGGLASCFEAGPWAMERFVAEPLDTRYLQSFKTFAASAAFQTTRISGASYKFEDLLAAFLTRYRHHAAGPSGAMADHVVVGRPVMFAGANPDAGLARQRYDAALQRFGITTCHHVYEPVAAAYYFAQRLTRDATVLVADFGGGTSDFSIIHFAIEPSGIRATPLSQSGVGVAGDTFDYRIIDRVLSPRLGKGTEVESWGKVLEFPAHYFASFARWNHLSLLKSQKVIGELRALARESLDREKIEAFIAFIEADAGYPLYQAVAACKMSLSSNPSAHLAFRAGGTTIDETISREAFEGWIAEDLDRIDAAVDQALTKAGLAPGQLDKVFLTGGSSFVPALQRRFADRFGADKVETGEQLLSIAYGLALIGADPDIERWTVAA